MADDEAFRRRLGRDRERRSVQLAAKQRPARTPVDGGQAERAAFIRQFDAQSPALFRQRHAALGLAHGHDPIDAGQRAGQAIADLPRPRRQLALHEHRRRGHRVRLEGRRRDAVEAVREFVDDVVGGELAGLKPGLVHHRGQERHIVAQALDVEILQRPAHAGDGVQTRRRPAAQFGDHRVVEHRDLVALAHAGVVAHDIAAPLALGRRLVADQSSDRR